MTATTFHIPSSFDFSTHSISFPNTRFILKANTLKNVIFLCARELSLPTLASLFPCLLSALSGPPYRSPPLFQISQVPSPRHHHPEELRHLPPPRGPHLHLSPQRRLTRCRAHYLSPPAPAITPRGNLVSTTASSAAARISSNEQRNLRDLLRAQSATSWAVVSTGMFTTFLFKSWFGVVERPCGRRDCGSASARLVGEWRIGDFARSILEG
jgi:hypothetical protein